jgi:translocator protein
MEIASIIGLACFITACFLTALTGAWFRPGEWYERLKKPSWRPPNRLFARVWTILYVMIAVAGWLIWREAGFAVAGLPLATYALQLILNAAWTPLFFGLHRPISASSTSFWSGCPSSRPSCFSIRSTSEPRCCSCPT